MAMSYLLALTEAGDVRELIPDNMVLPEMYKNHFKVNFGATQEKDTVDSIRLPGWANDDPYYFTTKMREFLEHDYVSLNISKWIDLFFGFKQKGENAVEATNLYPSITYEDGININTPENQMMLNSLTVQAYNFGQCPTQMFTEAHLTRSVNKITPSFIEQGVEVQNKTYDYQRAKYGILSSCKFSDNHNFFAFGSKRTLYGFTYNSFNENNKKDIITENSGFKKVKIVFDDSKIYVNEDTPIRILTKRDIQMIVGGYWDGRIAIKNFTKKEDFFKKKHLYRITCIEVSESENIIITGTVRGDIAKWTYEENTLLFDKPFFHHEDTVTHA